MTLGGNVCIRNGNELDYCWREAINSLLPVCDEVVVCDGESTDGTQEEIREWAKRDPKIKLCVYPWPNPKGDIEFWVNWLNYAREHLSTGLHIQLDADEILSERSYPEIERFKHDERDVLWCNRYNFWRDEHSLIPPGVCLSHRVARIGPKDIWMPSDGPHPKGGHFVSLAVDSDIEIFHYGFLRHPKQFFKKERLLHGYFFDTHDSRISEVEDKAGNWMQNIERVEWINRLVPYDRSHPQLAIPWLKERGYAVSNPNP